MSSPGISIRDLFPGSQLDLATGRSGLDDTTLGLLPQAEQKYDAAGTSNHQNYYLPAPYIPLPPKPKPQTFSPIGSPPLTRSAFGDSTNSPQKLSLTFSDSGSDSEIEIFSPSKYHPSKAKGPSSSTGKVERKPIIPLPTPSQCTSNGIFRNLKQTVIAKAHGHLKNRDVTVPISCRMLVIEEIPATRKKEADFKEKKVDGAQFYINADTESRGGFLAIALRDGFGNEFRLPENTFVAFTAVWQGLNLSDARLVNSFETFESFIKEIPLKTSVRITIRKGDLIQVAIPIGSPFLNGVRSQSSARIAPAPEDPKVTAAAKLVREKRSCRRCGRLCWPVEGGCRPIYDSMVREIAVHVAYKGLDPDKLPNTPTFDALREPLSSKSRSGPRTGMTADDAAILIKATLASQAAQAPPSTSTPALPSTPSHKRIRDLDDIGAPDTPSGLRQALAAAGLDKNDEFEKVLTQSNFGIPELAHAYGCVDLPFGLGAELRAKGAGAGNLARLTEAAVGVMKRKAEKRARLV